MIRQKLKASVLIQGAHGAKPNTWTGVLVMPLRGLGNGFGSFGTFKGVLPQKVRSGRFAVPFTISSRKNITGDKNLHLLAGGEKKLKPCPQNRILISLRGSFQNSRRVLPFYLYGSSLPTGDASLVTTNLTTPRLDREPLTS